MDAKRAASPERKSATSGEPAAKKAKLEDSTNASPGSSKKAGASSSKPTKTNTAPSNFFQPRSEKVAAAAAADKGKAKEEDDEEGASSAEDMSGDEHGSDDEEAVSKAAGKLADIFTKGSQSKSVTKAKWKVGEAVPYAALADTFDAISQTTKRLEITSILTHFLVEVIEKTPEDLVKVVYLCINRICPDYEGLELGIGDSILIKAIGESTGRKTQQVQNEYRKIGDLGQVAADSRGKQPTLFKPARLTVQKVFKTLKDIASLSGQSSQNKKVGLIKGLLSACERSETKFIIRSLAGKLRISLAEKTVVLALSHAIITSELNKSGKRISSDKMASRLEHGAEIIKAVYAEMPSYDLIIPALLEYGVDGLKDHCKLTPGLPLKPMLAKPTKAISEVLDRFEGKPFTCEYKYDGERAQVHLTEDGKVKVYSRNSEETSGKYPDIIDQFPHCVKESVTSCVVDCEAVAWDKDTGKLLPFQELSRRKRKDVKTEDIKVKVHLFAFDLLSLNGEPLLQKNLTERREVLFTHFKPVTGEFSFATSMDASSVEDIQAFLDQSIKDGCEGLMVKLLEGEGAGYEPSRRSNHWLKVKKDYLSGTGDSFDLVVIGADYGKGKRTNVYGNFLLATWDDDSETYQTVCKIGTGFSEESLQTFYDKLSPNQLNDKKGYYDIGEMKRPDVYFEPTLVWEVLAADLSLSPVYAAARGLCDEGRGVSLRFPRFIRIRDDKGPEDTTSPEQIAEAYERQVTAQSNQAGRKRGGGGGGGEDGFY